MLRKLLIAIITVFFNSSETTGKRICDKPSLKLLTQSPFVASTPAPNRHPAASSGSSAGHLAGSARHIPTIQAPSAQHSGGT